MPALVENNKPLIIKSSILSQCSVFLFSYGIVEFSPNPEILLSAGNANILIFYIVSVRQFSIIFPTD